MSLDTVGAIYASTLNCDIKIIPCCVRDAAHPVLSQQIINGCRTHGGDAIGFGQGEILVEVPYLRLQVQN
jgi:methylmalonyl-CoA mutase cobalamin-binding subunit